MLEKNDLIYVAGHTGLVGSALVENLRQRGYGRLLLRTHAELDLCDQRATREFLSREKPDVILLAAARVGGIHANMTYPAEFAYENLAIQTNVVHEAYRAGIRRMCFIGSSCIYPRLAPQPIPESALMTGTLEPTNAPYAAAKIAGIFLCEAYNRQYGTQYLSVMPTNSYGPGDSFDLETSHVLPAVIRRIHEAKREGAKAVTLWGTGKPLREFIYSADLADACVHLLEHSDDTALTNIGTGEEISIGALAHLTARIVGYTGEIRFDASKPDGTPQKKLDTSRLRATGWAPRTNLEEGIRITYDWYVRHHA